MSKSLVGESSDNQVRQLAVQMYYEKVYQAAYHIVKCRHQADDIAQETFIKFYQKKPKIENERQMLRWLYVTATNTGIDYLRKRKKEEVRASEDIIRTDEKKQLNSSVEEQVIHNDLKDRIEKEIGRLPLIYQQIILLHYKYDYSPAEIAEALDMNRQTVGTRLFRAKKQLRERILSNDYVEGGE